MIFGWEGLFPLAVAAIRAALCAVSAIPDQCHHNDLRLGGSVSPWGIFFSDPSLLT